MSARYRKAASGVLAALLSAGLCLGGATAANATTRYAVTSGSWSEGDYMARWAMSSTESHVRAVALASYIYCEAVQGSDKVSMVAAPRQECRADAYRQPGDRSEASVTVRRL